MDLYHGPHYFTITVMTGVTSLLDPEQLPTFTAVISVITTTTRPDKQQRHSRPLFVCTVYVDMHFQKLLNSALYKLFWSEDLTVTLNVFILYLMT